MEPRQVVSCEGADVNLEHIYESYDCRIIFTFPVDFSAAICGAVGRLR